MCLLVVLFDVCCMMGNGVLLLFVMYDVVVVLLFDFYLFVVDYGIDWVVCIV